MRTGSFTKTVCCDNSPPASLRLSCVTTLPEKILMFYLVQDRVLLVSRAALLLVAFVIAAEGRAHADETRYVNLPSLAVFSSAGQTIAAEFLCDEISRRTDVAVSVAGTVPPNTQPTVFMGTVAEFPVSYPAPKGMNVPEIPDGFGLSVDTRTRQAPTIYIIGRDERGVLFGAGMLVRRLNIGRNTINIDEHLQVTSAPHSRIRGHKLLPEQHDFIDWNSWPDKSQLVKDMVIFGTNTFNLNRFHNPIDEQLSRMLEAYGLDLWLTFGGGRVMSINNVADVRDEFGHLTGIDAVSIPGGDSSGTPEHRVLIPQIARFGPAFKQCFPKATVWFSNQCGQDHAKEDNDFIFDFLNRTQPAWLEGMSYGPWTKMDIAELRRRLPAQYKIRLKADICHNRGCMFPVPKWDRAMARAWGRNGISVMPRMMAAIHRAMIEHTEGFVAYNHTGVVNDLNKFVWSARAWDPNTPVYNILYDYGKVFFGYEHAETVAQGLLMLEDNWTGRLEHNNSPLRALEHWKTLVTDMGGADAVAENWRLELYLTKAYIDAQVKRKYDAEMRCERNAYKALADARNQTASQAIKTARSSLAEVDTSFQSKEDFRREMERWGLRRYGDMDEILDNMYHALNDRQWLDSQFDEILDMDSESDRLAAIDSIIDWENPGPGGFYDNLGVVGMQPHLVRARRWEDDPGFDYSPIEFNMHKPNSNLRHSMLVSAVTRYDNPLVMRYKGLDPDARYSVHVIYNGPWNSEMKCETDDGFLIHGPFGNTGSKRAEFDVPAASTRDGDLELQWRVTTVTRGPSVTEIWLRRD